MPTKQEKELLQSILDEVFKLHQKSESRAAELECSQGAYEDGLEDVFEIIKRKMG